MLKFLSKLFPDFAAYFYIAGMIRHAKKHNLKGLIIWPNSHDANFRHHFMGPKHLGKV